VYKRGISFLGTKQPLGVVVISPLEKKAFKISEEELPGVKKLLNAI